MRNAPWSGPWRILDECPSYNHNSLNTARGINGEKCICPRALALYEISLERMRARARRTRIQNGQWYRGPWRISDDCQARGHNTITWARGDGKRRDDPNCICPHALALLQKFKHERNGRERGKRFLPVHQRIQPQAPVPDPDWSLANCRDESKMHIVDMGFNDDMTKKGIERRAAAKNLCRLPRCPVFDECKEWIIAKEREPGELGGVYAGMDRWNRQGLDLVIVGKAVKKVDMK